VSRFLLIAMVTVATSAAMPVSSSVAAVADECYYVEAQVQPNEPSYGARICPPPPSTGSTGTAERAPATAR
jgi:hypothetical protein